MTYDAKVGRHPKLKQTLKCSGTLNDNALARQANIIDIYDPYRDILILRGIEGGPGINVTVTDADNIPNNIDRYRKIVISSTSSSGTSPYVDVATPVGVANETINMLSNIPLAGSVKCFVNGLLLNPAGYTVSGTSITFNDAVNGYSLSSTDTVVAWYLA